MSYCANPHCKEKDLHPAKAFNFDGCCSALCAEILDGYRKDDLIEELQKQLKDLWAQFRALQEKWQYVSNQNLEYMGQVGELQSDLHKALMLLDDVSSAHKDQRSFEYNHCDTAPCHFCTEADELKKKHEVTK